MIRILRFQHEIAVVLECNNCRRASPFCRVFPPSATPANLIAAGWRLRKFTPSRRRWVVCLFRRNGRYYFHGDSCPKCWRARFPIKRKLKPDGR